MLRIIFIFFLSQNLHAFEDLAVWKKNFKEVRYEQIEPDFSANMPFQLPLVIVKSQSSAYSRQEILQEVNLMNLIYRTCSVAFNSIHFYEVKDAQDGHYNRFEFSTEDSIDSLRGKVPVDQSIPIAFFVGEIMDHDKSSGFSFARWRNNFGLRPALYNTVFISNYSLSEEYREFNPKRYSLLAHEFMHVLTRKGSHIAPDYRSLMSISSARTNRVLPKTCEDIYTNNDLQWQQQ